MVKEILERMNTNMAYKHGVVTTGDGEVAYHDIDARLRNQEVFAQPIESSHETITDGLFLDSCTLELGGGHFTNKYDLYFSADEQSYTPKISTRKTPLYTHRLFQGDKEGKLFACINGSFFCLHDGNQQRTPEEIVYNLNIRDNQIMGLPSVERPVLYTTPDGQLHAKNMKAQGTIRINDEVFFWEGGEPYAHQKKHLVENDKVILFNSACCSIAYEDPNDKKSLRKLQETNNFTPNTKDVVDVVISYIHDHLVVSDIRVGGGTDFFKGNFILHFPKKNLGNISVGDIVYPETLDTVSLSNITSGITTGPMVHHFLQSDDHDINHDPSLGTFPPFAADARYARSVIYKSPDQFIHMTIFDAVPRSEKMKGVTPKEVAEHIPQEAVWAVFLDGGQSSRITFRNGNGIDFRGNQQYIRLHKRDKKTQSGSSDERYLWSRRGRELCSTVQLWKI